MNEKNLLTLSIVVSVVSIAYLYYVQKKAQPTETIVNSIDDDITAVENWFSNLFGGSMGNGTNGTTQAASF